MGVQVGKNDSTETNIKVSGGAGSYAYITRGCEGEVLTKDKVPFKDLGYSIDHKFKFPVRVGLRGGNIWERNRYYPDERRTNSYLNPDLSLEWKWFGIGAGPFFAQKDLPTREGGKLSRNSLSWHLRFGSPKLYFSIHMLESVPLYSGGGYINLGLGGGVSRKFSLWFGLGTKGPYDTEGFLAKTNIKLKGNWYVDLVGRLGTSAGISESAISFGLNYKFITK